MDLGLQDKVAIITGGSDGIGKAAALSMANEGAAVVIVARRPDVLDQAAQEIMTATEGQVLPISADVMEPDSARSIVQTTLDKFGRVDILVNMLNLSEAWRLRPDQISTWQQNGCQGCSSSSVGCAGLGGGRPLSDEFA